MTIARVAIAVCIAVAAGCGDDRPAPLTDGAASQITNARLDLSLYCVDVASGEWTGRKYDRALRHTGTLLKQLRRNADAVDDTQPDQPTVREQIAEVADLLDACDGALAGRLDRALARR